MKLRLLIHTETLQPECILTCGNYQNMKRGFDTWIWATIFRREVCHNRKQIKYTVWYQQSYCFFLAFVLTYVLLLQTPKKISDNVWLYELIQVLLQNFARDIWQLPLYQILSLTVTNHLKPKVQISETAMNQILVQNKTMRRISGTERKDCRNFFICVNTVWHFLCNGSSFCHFILITLLSDDDAAEAIYVSSTIFF